ncbi:hypothetical protein QQX98_010993 [Neonectria punicea]|uniref:Uncharacterized protein n=1 Tax=Neonectria punicea TaxID=979145 RepID=A0ABR1GN64_9HYPO
MAEIEMEVDMTKPLNQDAHLDDDFIDFDTDMVDQPELLSLHSAGPQKLVEAGANPEDDAHAAGNIGYPEENEADAALREDAELGGVEALTNDMDVTENDTTYTADPASLGTKDDVLSLPQQSEEDDGYVEIPDADENVHKALDEAHASDHEIDYELGEQAEEHEPHGELKPDEETPAVPSTDAEVENTVGDDVLEPERDIVTEGLEGGHDDHGGYEDHKEEAEEDEITYDDDEALEPELSPAQDDETAHHVDEDVAKDELDEDVAKDELDDEAQVVEDVSGEDARFYGHSEQKATPDGDFDVAHGPFDVESETHDEVVYVSAVRFQERSERQTIQDGDTEEVQYGEYDAESEQQDPSVSGHNSVAVSEIEFPAITVQYKGDEFPFFSNGSDGFFTETSILDETVEKLLSGFRDELANEIAHEEELVFQVDELGLEFAESCLRDSLSSVTLRQILEIFDLLVKNQDPDSSRTLYTYLFTRPCASKRLESLIESATAGKGLDEVIHLFESPVRAAASALETNTADGNDERLDDFDSPPDEADEISKEDMGDEIDYAEDGVDLNASISGNNQDANEDEQDVNEDEQDVNDDEQNANEGDQDTADDDYIEGHTVEPTSEDVIGADDHASDVAAIEQPIGTNAHDESESNPLINLELDDGTKIEDEVDLEVDSDADEENPIDLDVGNLGTSNTSTTTTLKDEGDAGSAIVDAVTETTATVLPDKIEEAGEDDVGEIDWRDEPEALEIPSTPSAAGKRPRGDDELDVEDEQDVKRRRP